MRLLIVFVNYSQSEYAAADVLVLPGILHRLVRDSKIQPDKFMLALHIGPSSTSALSNSASSSDSKHDCAVVSGIYYDLGTCYNVMLLISLTGF